MLDRPRQSRILYRGKLYEYPLVPMNALRNLGPVEAMRCVASYVWVRVRPPKNQDTLEGFYAARFGWRLYQHFFKTYTEKVWGVPAVGALRRLGRAAREGPLDPPRRRGGDEAEALAPVARQRRTRSRA